jgi:UDP-N-acetyl-D-galactosamine dehydrogenase|tara:strand:- start:605 stop:1888 length:1284 start_codon:yes stop_codon:yes gene_type:complete
MPSKINIAVLGLGYVGLPLMLALSKKFSVTGFDTSAKRIRDLKNGVDHTKESKPQELHKIKNLLTNSVSHIQDSNVFIVTVPTPINNNKTPDLRFINSACKIIGNILKKNDLVIFESTVYPGLTEEVCVPILEKISSLTYREDFSVGYSPERINPGDHHHKIQDIVKVVSGSDKKAAEQVNYIYSEIISAGTHIASSIKVAEAAKVIENTQRDINIALINELSRIFDLMNIDTNEVLEAAKTKWNFIDFKPGLVGGHCIGVDPYYLTHKSESLGFSPQMILAGRNTNEYVPKFIVNKSLKEMKSREMKPKSSKALLMGLSFKENCPDTRNSKSFETLALLSKAVGHVDVFDPIALVTGESFKQIKQSNFQVLKNLPKKRKYSLIIIAVSHTVFKKIGAEAIKLLGLNNAVVFDVKALYPTKNQFLRL